MNRIFWRGSIDYAEQLFLCKAGLWVVCTLLIFGIFGCDSREGPDEWSSEKHKADKEGKRLGSPVNHAPREKDNGGGAARKTIDSERIKSYQSAWLNLREIDGFDNYLAEENKLASDMANQLMFSEEMVEMIQFLKKHDIQNTLAIRLKELLKNDQTGEVKRSLLKNFAILEELHPMGGFIELLLDDIDNEKVAQITELAKKTSPRMVKRVNIAIAKQIVSNEPIKALDLAKKSFPEGDLSPADQHAVRELFGSSYIRGSAEVRVLLDELGKNSAQEKSSFRNLATEKLYETLGLLSPPAAAEYVNRDGWSNGEDREMLKAIATGVYYRQEPLEMVKWLDQIVDSTNADYVRSVLAQRLGSSEVTASVIATGIRDDKLREETLRFITKKVRSEEIEGDAAQR